MKKLGFGCMRLPLLDKSNEKSIDIEQLKKMVDVYLENGFTYFDTAYFYHGGESERAIKKVLVDRYPRESFLLATKMPSMLLKEKEDIPRIFSEQLEKTGAGYFDYYLLHCVTKRLYKVDSELGAFSYLAEKKAEGKIKKLGFSFHDKADVLDQILTEHPEMEFVQLQINYLDWENPDVQSRKCYEVARKHGKEVIVMEPVKGGALATVPTNAEKMLKDLDKDMSIASWAIRFAAGLENVITVLSGMSNLEQLLDNTGYMREFKPLSEGERGVCLEVAEEIKKSKVIPCTGCRYCVEKCSSNIQIPEYFGLYNNYVLGKHGSFSQLREDYKKLSDEGGKISDCIGCKLCEGSCPQHIKVADTLKLIAKTIEK